jgi:hypothetical protein
MLCGNGAISSGGIIGRTKIDLVSLELLTVGEFEMLTNHSKRFEIPGTVKFSITETRCPSRILLILCSLRDPKGAFKAKS